ncbi:MAG: hypothetical protein DCF22_09175 [Leptolyngbya sp.]|nr:MAG: hypothetical protein DCF22_09175 [Leptolyngbya sp.]
MTDDRSIPTQSSVETPLGIQQPLLPPVPLGQSMLQPKFFTPLGARSLRVLDPSIFLPASDLAFPNEESSFQDSPFFDAPDSSTPSQSTVPTIQTQPQPRPLKPAPSEINLPTTAPFEGIAETPLIETSPVEDLAITEPLIARSPIPETDAAIASPATEAIQSAPSEVAAIARTPQNEPLNRFESPSPSISSLSTETPIDTPAEHSIEPLPSNISALDDPPTETANEYPEAPLLQRSPSSSDNLISPTSTQPTYPAAIQRTTNLEDSVSLIAPISAENTITPAATDLTSSDADLTESIQPEFNLTDNILPIASASDPTTASSQPVDHSEAIPDVEAEIAQPILDSPAAIARLTADESIDPIVDVAESSPMVALPPVVDHSESISSTDSSITQRMLDAPEVTARLSGDKSIDPVVDIAESLVQSASDRVPQDNQEIEDPLLSATLPQANETEVISLLSSESEFRDGDRSNAGSQEELAIPASSEFSLSAASDLSSEPSSAIASLREPEGDFDFSSPSESIAGQTIQRSPVEPVISEPAIPDLDPDRSVAAIASHPADSPISDAEVVQPKTNDLGRDELESEELEKEELEDPVEMSLEPASSKVDIDSPAINSIQDQTATQPAIQANSLDPSSILHHQPEPSEENATSADGSNLLSSPKETEIETGIETEKSLPTSSRSVEEKSLQDFEAERVSQPIALETPGQRVQPEIDPQLDPVTQSNTELTIQHIPPKAEPIAAEATVSAIQPEIMTQADTQSVSDRPTPEWIESTPAESEARFAHPPISDRPITIQPPSIQPISEISPPIQRKGAEAENIVSEVEATVENKSSVEVDRTSPLPELPSVLQRLSILEPIAPILPLHTTPVPAVQPAPAISSSVPEIQAQPFEPIAGLPFDTSSVRRKSSVEANDYITQNAIAPALESPTRNSLPQDSPVPTEWANIADLLQPSVDHRSRLEPEIAFADDSYPELLHSDNSAPNNMIQPSPAPTVAAIAPAETQPHETETQGDRQPPAHSEKSGSPEHLERLAQEIYQLIRQRLALERERGGKSGSGRLL